MEIVSPLNFIPYSKKEAIDHLENQYGWRYYGGKHYESRWTRFYQSYYLPQKFGYDKRKAHLASLIVTDQMTREEALAELEKPLVTDNELAEDKAFIAKKLGIGEAELDDFIRQPPRHYKDYPTNEAQLKWSLRAYGLLSRAGRLIGIGKPR